MAKNQAQELEEVRKFRLKKARAQLRLATRIVKLAQKSREMPHIELQPSDAKNPALHHYAEQYYNKCLNNVAFLKRKNEK